MKNFTKMIVVTMVMIMAMSTWTFAAETKENNKPGFFQRMGATLDTGVEAVANTGKKAGGAVVDGVCWVGSGLKQGVGHVVGAYGNVCKWSRDKITNPTIKLAENAEKELKK